MPRRNRRIGSHLWHDYEAKWCHALAYELHALRRASTALTVVPGLVVPDKQETPEAPTSEASTDCTSSHEGHSGCFRQSA